MFQRFSFSFVLQESYNGASRDRSLEDKSPRSQHYDGAKKARIHQEGQNISANDPYGLFLYQTMAAAMAGKGQVHPAALAAYTQALKVSTMQSRKSY